MDASCRWEASLTDTNSIPPSVQRTSLSTAHLPQYSAPPAVQRPACFLTRPSALRPKPHASQSLSPGELVRGRTSGRTSELARPLPLTGVRLITVPSRLCTEPSRFRLTVPSRCCFRSLTTSMLSRASSFRVGTFPITWDQQEIGSGFWRGWAEGLRLRLKSVGCRRAWGEGSRVSALVFLERAKTADST
eukprot:1943876-Rhodomonas_salina.3